MFPTLWCQLMSQHAGKQLKYLIFLVMLNLSVFILISFFFSWLKSLLDFHKLTNSLQFPYKLPWICKYLSLIRSFINKHFFSNIVDEINTVHMHSDAILSG